MYNVKFIIWRKGFISGQICGSTLEILTEGNSNLDKSIDKQA